MKVGDRVKLNLAGKRWHCNLFSESGADKTDNPGNAAYHWYASIKKHRDAIGMVMDVYDMHTTHICSVRWHNSGEMHSYCQKHLTVIDSV